MDFFTKKKRVIFSLCLFILSAVLGFSYFHSFANTQDRVEPNATALPESATLPPEVSPLDDPPPVRVKTLAHPTTSLKQQAQTLHFSATSSGE